MYEYQKIGCKSKVNPNSCKQSLKLMAKRGFLTVKHPNHQDEQGVSDFFQKKNDLG